MYLVLIIPVVLLFFGLFIVLITQNRGQAQPVAIDARVYTPPKVQYNYGVLKRHYNAGLTALRKGQSQRAINNFDVLIGSPGHNLKIQRYSYIHKAEALCRQGQYTRMGNVLGAYYGIYKYRAKPLKDDWCLANSRKPRPVNRVIKSQGYDEEAARLDHMLGEGDTIRP